MAFQYPDEPSWWASFEADEATLFTEAHRVVNWQAFRYAARTGFDVGNGLEPETARTLHLAECAAELGQGAPPRPQPSPGPASYPQEPSWWAAVEAEAAGLYDQCNVPSPSG